MKFRPCIDIHNGKVKQIVGSSLRDAGDFAKENFVAQQSAADFARMFRKDGLTGGHIIVLNSKDSPYYDASVAAAKEALAAFPNAFSVGGGITPDNANTYLDAGAREVIVTSYLFADGQLSMERVRAMEAAVGKERLILDLSCQSFDGSYFIMCDRWQTKTDAVFDTELMDALCVHCQEFLVHAVAQEGKGEGIDASLLAILASSPVPVTYAGGIRDLADVAAVARAGKGRVDFTVGSALDIYGGALSYRALLSTCQPNGPRV